MIKRITFGWNIMGVIRLIAGITALVFAIIYADRFLGLAGIVLLLMSVLNIGCCGVSECSTGSCKPPLKSSIKASEKNGNEEVA